MSAISAGAQYRRTIRGSIGGRVTIFDVHADLAPHASAHTTRPALWAMLKRSAVAGRAISGRPCGPSRHAHSSGARSSARPTSARDIVRPSRNMPAIDVAAIAIETTCSAARQPRERALDARDVSQRARRAGVPDLHGLTDGLRHHDSRPRSGLYGLGRAVPSESPTRLLGPGVTSGAGTVGSGAGTCPGGAIDAIHGAGVADEVQLAGRVHAEARRDWRRPRRVPRCARSERSSAAASPVAVFTVSAHGPDAARTKSAKK